MICSLIAGSTIDLVFFSSFLPFFAFFSFLYFMLLSIDRTDFFKGIYTVSYFLIWNSYSFDKFLLKLLPWLRFLLWQTRALKKKSFFFVFSAAIIFLTSLLIGTDFERFFKTNHSFCSFYIFICFLNSTWKSSQRSWSSNFCLKESKNLYLMKIS